MGTIRRCQSVVGDSDKGLTVVAEILRIKQKVSRQEM